MTDYRLADVFSFERGTRWVAADHVAGETPYISSSGKDNGISDFVTPADFMTVYRNRITLSNSGTVGVAFYHPYEFVVSDHCMVLAISDESVELDEDLFLFLRPVLESIRHRYNFGREINSRRLAREVIALPSKADGSPDWESMRAKVRSIRPSITFKAIDHEHRSPEDLYAVRWAEFRLADFFEQILPGKCGNAQQLLVDGNDLPYIGAKRDDYGVVKLVSYPHDDRLVLNGPCLALICDGQGSVGYSTYVPFDEFVGTTTVKFAYHPELDVEVAAFLTTALDLNRPRFSFGRKWGARVNNTVVSLPCDESGAPDFDFMRRYIRSLRYGELLDAS